MKLMKILPGPAFNGKPEKEDDGPVGDSGAGEACVPSSE